MSVYFSILHNIYFFNFFPLFHNEFSWYIFLLNSKSSIYYFILVRNLTHVIHQLRTSPFVASLKCEHETYESPCLYPHTRVTRYEPPRSYHHVFTTIHEPTCSWHNISLSKSASMRTNNTHKPIPTALSLGTS